LTENFIGEKYASDEIFEDLDIKNYDIEEEYVINHDS